MKNPVKKFDNTFKKLLIRFCLTISYSLFAVGVFSNLESLFPLQPLSILFIFIIIIGFLYVYTVIITKTSRDVFSVMSLNCSYTDLEYLVSEETFALENDLLLGIGQVYTSKHWLIINGTFVPKKFILYFYQYKTNNNQSKIILYCINGSKLYINVPHKGNYIDIYSKLKKYTPNCKLIQSQKEIDHKIYGNTLKNVLFKYNITLERYINSYRNYSL